MKEKLLIVDGHNLLFQMFYGMPNKIYNEDQTQIFIETPYRNAKIIETILNSLRPTTKLCIAAGITCENEYIKTKTIAQWKKEKLPELGKTPAIFLLYK